MKINIPDYTTTFHVDGHDVHMKYGAQPVIESVSFHGDHLKTSNKVLDFLQDPKFVKAYDLGMAEPRKAKPEIAKTLDLRFRFHTCLWAAKQASKLEGDFVECGVNLGGFSLAICDYLDFNNLDKSFFLFDTYTGIPESHVSEGENINEVRQHNNLVYFDCYETTKKSFKPYPKAKLVKGTVPETLTDVEIEKVSYLSIDMNLAKPEVAALEFFWDKLVPGALVVLDDYGWAAHIVQKRAIDAFVKSKDYEVLTLPTGQGLLIK